MSKSDYLENEVLKWCTSQSSIFDASPPARWLALFTTSPGETGGGTEVSASSTGYARISVAGKFGAPNAGTISNSAILSFPTPTAIWGTVLAVGLFDAATNGNLLRYVPLTTSKPFDVGDSATFQVGALIFRED